MENNKETPNTAENKKYDIGSVDPSGSSETGLFAFNSGNDYKISHITDENGLNQAEKLGAGIVNCGLREIAVETGKLHAGVRYTFQMPNLIKVVGFVEIISKINNIKYTSIFNSDVGLYEKKARNGEINGLRLMSIKQPRGAPKKAGAFRGAEVSEHEKDAILVFYVYGTRKLKKEGPGAD